jgi:hypothetical protein
MAKELKHIDVSHTPELLRLAEEVRRTRQPHILRRDREDMAVVFPLTARTAAGREQVTETQIWADAGITDPANIWADYDAAKVQAGLQQARGALAGVDRDELLGDVYEAREQDTNARPA